MKDSAYIKATNKAKVSMALNILRDILAGDRYGVDEHVLNDVIGRLIDIDESLLEAIIDED